MTNLNPQATFVKKDPPWVLLYDSYDELGISPDGSFHPSLEERVCSDVERTENQKRFTLNRCPELVSSTILYLRGKHEKIQTQAAVQRLVSKAGVIVLQRDPALKKIVEKRKVVYETGDERDRLRFRNISSYNLRSRLSIAEVKNTIYTSQWVGSKIVELASDLALPQETIVIEALIAGLVTSEKWVPSRHTTVMFNEMIRFVNWVNELSEEL